MIDATRELVQLLSQDVTVAQISARVGPIAEDKKPPLAVELKPKMSGVSAARVVRYPESDDPFSLELDLKKAARPTVAALRERFGEYKTTQSDIGQPKQLIFRPPAGARWKVVLIVTLDARPGPVRATDAAARIAFRRDRVKP